MRNNRVADGSRFQYSPRMESQKALTGRAWIEMGALALLWGASFLSVRVILDEVPVMTAVLHRTGWSAAILWGVVLAMRLPVPREFGTWMSFLVMGALNNAVPFCLMAWGQLHIESGLTSIFNASTAIFGVVVAALVFSDERLTPRRVAGTAIGFLGVATAIGLEALADFDLRSAAQLAVVAGAFSYACAGAWARARLAGLSPIVAAAGMLTGATALVAPVSLAADGIPRLDLEFRTLVAIAYLAAGATVGAYLLYFRVLATAGAGNLLLVTLLIPPVAILLGALVLDEPLHPQGILGFAILATGLLVLDGRVGRFLRKGPAPETGSE